MFACAAITVPSAVAKLNKIPLLKQIIPLLSHLNFVYAIGGASLLACPPFIISIDALLYLSIDFCATYDDIFRDIYELLYIR